MISFAPASTRGDCLYRKHHPETDAVLFRDQTKKVEILRLRHAHLKRIDGGGIMLGGTDSHIVNQYQRQAWWVVPSAP